MRASSCDEGGVYKGHAVVISGDTRFNENVIKHGTGVDVLVHENRLDEGIDPVWVTPPQPRASVDA